jgi:hypothetical protein
MTMVSRALSASDRKVSSPIPKVLDYTSRERALPSCVAQFGKMTSRLKPFLLFGLPN